MGILGGILLISMSNIYLIEVLHLLQSNNLRYMINHTCSNYMLSLLSSSLLYLLTYKYFYTFFCIWLKLYSICKLSKLNAWSTHLGPKISLKSTSSTYANCRINKLKLLLQLVVSNRIRLVLHDELYNILGYLIISINLHVFFWFNQMFYTLKQYITKSGDLERVIR